MIELIMNYTKFLILSFFLFGFMGAADVFASSHNKHEMNDHGGVYPFDKKQGGKPIHCLLNNHSHKDTFCPHTRLPSGENSTHRISFDCGGQTTGNILTNSANNIYLIEAQLYKFVTPSLNEKILSTISYLSDPLKDSLDPPPRVL
jgi:hypothetical protein